MEQTDWPPKGSMGPIFSEYLFIRFFQRGGEETGKNDQRYWPISKFQELLMQLNFYTVPDPKMIKKGKLYRGSYISTHILLNLLTSLGKGIMRGSII